jgi:hypothetical protein
MDTVTCPGPARAVRGSSSDALATTVGQERQLGSAQAGGHKEALPPPRNRGDGSTW